MFGENKFRSWKYSETPWNDTLLEFCSGLPHRTSHDGSFVYLHRMARTQLNNSSMQLNEYLEGLNQVLNDRINLAYQIRKQNHLSLTPKPYSYQKLPVSYVELTHGKHLERRDKHRIEYSL